MEYDEFKKTVSKFSKEALILTLYRSTIRAELMISKVKNNDYELMSSKLLDEDAAIIEKMRELDGNDISSRIEFLKLLEKSQSIHIKLDKLNKSLEGIETC